MISRKKTTKYLMLVVLCLVIFTQSTLIPASQTERIRGYTRPVEFDFIRWTLDAMLLKQVQEAVQAPSYMGVEDQREAVFEYLRLVRWINETRAEIERIYANPEIEDPDKEAAELNERLETLTAMEYKSKPIAEAVLQQQVSTVLADLDLGLGGQPIPPVLYHSTRLPNALIISPRDVIRQDENISLVPEMTTEEINQLEDEVSEKEDVSALVVPVGGIGTYPTMVMNTTNLEWLTEVVSHEWVHNFLTTRPLGVLYMESPQLRTMNETTANIAGKEIGQAVLERFYPELAPPPPPVEETPEKPDQPTPTPTPEDPNVFNFNREMNKTRVRADELLQQGKIDEAEEYMEQRRRFFWENGYQIRKLNQAYFAFHGAYSDDPGGGAAGRDPVGPAVQELRKQSSSLAEFLNRISFITTFAGLLEEVEK